MKCCSRYTLAVIIGSLHIVASLIGIIIMGIFLVEIHNDKNTVIAEVWSVTFTIIAVSLTLAVLSGLYIWGALKRRHNLIMPFLILYVIGFIASCIMFGIGFLGAAIGNASQTEFIMFIIIFSSILVLEALIFFFSYKLYRHIQRKNLRPHRSAIAEASCYYTAV